MANDGGRLEALIKPSLGGTWTISVTDNGGAFNVTLSEETYLSTAATGASSSLLGELQADLRAGSSSANASSYTVTVSDAGLVTIANPDDSFSVNWSSGTTARDLLGFTGNLSTAVSHTATKVSQAVWVPHSPYLSDYDADDEGYEVSDAISTIAPSGQIKSLFYNRRTQKEITFEMLLKRYVRTAAESTGNESLQTFIRGTQWGDYTWASSVSPIRFYETKTTTTSYVDYVWRSPGQFQPQPRIQGLTTVYDFTFELAKYVA